MISISLKNNLVTTLWMLINISFFPNNLNAAQNNNVCAQPLANFPEVTIFDSIRLNCTEWLQTFLLTNSDINIKNEFGETLLLYAINRNANKEIIIVLLERGANPHFETGHKLSMTPLIQVIHNGDIETLKLLMQYTDNINQLNSNNATLLYYAVLFNKPEIVTLLLENNADANGAGGRNPILIVPSQEILFQLLDAGANINYTNDEGINVLMGAARFGDDILIKVLINMGFEVNISDIYGYTPLMFAVDSEQLENVKILLESGASIKVKNKDGESALDIAQRREAKDIVEYIKASEP